MTKKAVVVLNTYLLLFVSAAFGQSQLVWRSESSLPNIGRADGVSLVLNGKLYIGCGRDYMGRNLNDFWEFDPATGIWTEKKPYPGEGKFGNVGFSIKDIGFVGLGYDSIRSKEFYSYDPIQDQWTPIADFPGAGRYHASAFVLGDTAFVGTGLAGVGVTEFASDMYMYVAGTDTWTKLSDFPGGPCMRPASFTLDGFGYFGNITIRQGSSSAPDNRFWRYDKMDDSWTQITSMPGNARRLTGTFNYNGKAYVGCGTYSGSPIQTYLNDFYQYDPVQDSWTKFNSSDNFTPRISRQFFSIGDSMAYVMGGSYLNHKLADCWSLKTNFDSCDYYYDTTIVYITVEDTLDIMLKHHGNCDSLLVKIYPNPTSEFVHVFSPDYDCFKDREIMIIDLLGRVVESKRITSAVTEFDIRNLATSLYFIKCIDADSEVIFSKKIEVY